MLLYCGSLYAPLDDAAFTDYNVAMQLWQLAKQEGASNEAFTILINPLPTIREQLFVCARFRRFNNTGNFNRQVEVRL